MPSINGQGQRLDTWKEIAAYLGRHERTLIRWEQRKGLPVRRVPGGERQAVFAYTAELDAWLMREEPDPQGLKPAPNVQADGTAEAVPFPKPVGLRSWRAYSGSRGLKYYAAAVMVAALVSLFVMLGRRTNAAGPNLPVRVGFTLNSLQAFDAEGRLLWSYALAGTVDPTESFDWRRLEDGVRIADFYGDGDREVLAVLTMRVGPNAIHVNRSEVDMFSSRGKLLWSYVPHGHFIFGTHDLKDSWFALDVFVSDHGKKQIWVAVDHGYWGHSFVVNLDPETGKDTLRYVNSGTTLTLNELARPNGNFLLAGGFNNEYDSGSLAVINEAKSFAVSPQTEGTNHKCKNCPKGDLDNYFVFPRSEVNELMQFYEDRVFRIRVTDDEIGVLKKETEWTAGASSLYVLRNDSVIRPVSVGFDTNYDLLHQKLEREGKIGHRLEDCPERLHPRPIRMWTPATGWTEIQLPPTRADE